VNFDCMFEKDSNGWFGWISPLDSIGNITDEFITRRYARKHGADCGLRAICNKMGFGKDAQDAITEAMEGK
jgi:hypothetical protein